MTSDKIYILQKAQAGDRSAMRLIYEEYYQYVLDYCHRYLMNYNESKDVTQDIFIRVFEKLANYKFESDFGAWLNIVCRNHIISYIRVQHKNKFESLPDNIAASAYNEEEDINLSELEQYRRNLSTEELYQMMEKLDEKSRTIFNLYVLDNLTHKEIASHLGISEGTSKSQLSRARVKLKELLKQEFEKNNRLQKSSAKVIALMLAILMICKECMS